MHKNQGFSMSGFWLTILWQHLGGDIAVNWDEVRRLANLPEYRNFFESVQLVGEVADELKIKNPLHPD
jgi:hypothetical protein